MKNVELLTEYGHLGVRYLIEGIPKMQPIADYIQEHVMNKRASLQELFSEHKMQRMKDLFEMDFSVDISFEEDDPQIAEENVKHAKVELEELEKYIKHAEQNGNFLFKMLLIPE